MATTSGADALTQIRRMCFALPETNERLSHGSPCFFIRDKKSFVYFHDANRYDEDGTNIWCPAPPGVQEQMVDAEPSRFYRPPYVGHRGWIGVRLDVEPDWNEIAGIVEEAFRHVAPTTILKQLEA